jgi:hypothetical protein
MGGKPVVTATAALGDDRKIGVRQIPDERLRTVEWRDLLDLTRGEVVYEALITAPWLAGSLAAWHFAGTSHHAFVGVALMSAFFFFLTGLRQVHNAYHRALGFMRRDETARTPAPV